jgi:hypothetical protein
MQGWTSVHEAWGRKALPRAYKVYVHTHASWIDCGLKTHRKPELIQIIPETPCLEWLGPIDRGGYKLRPLSPLVRSPLHFVGALQGPSRVLGSLELYEVYPG